MHLTTLIGAMLSCLSLIVQVLSANTKSTFGSGRMNESQTATYAEFTKVSHKEILTRDMDSAKVRSPFAAQDDAWEQNFSTQDAITGWRMEFSGAALALTVLAGSITVFTPLIPREDAVQASADGE